MGFKSTTSGSGEDHSTPRKQILHQPGSNQDYQNQYKKTHFTSLNLIQQPHTRHALYISYHQQHLSDIANYEILI